jgi:hypothetical protein
MTDERIEALERLAETVGACRDGSASLGAVRRAHDALKALDETKHEWPESNDDLIEETFEVADGVACKVVSERAWLAGRSQRYNCLRACGRWYIYTAAELRTYKPLGPSPRKQIEQARKRVCEAVRTWHEANYTDPEQSLHCAVTLLCEAHRELEALEMKHGREALEGAKGE